MNVNDLTIEEKHKIREQMSMSQFNFMLDDLTKLQVLKKLKENGLDTKKGSISALIRVLLAQFAESDSPEWIEYTCHLVKQEYLFTTKRNKRSTVL